jgi:hypothetical protein
MLRIETDPRATTDEHAEREWVLAWTPEEPLRAGTEIELRGYNLRTLAAPERWGALRLEGADAACLFRVEEEPTFNDIAAHNPTRAVARYRLQEEVASGRALRFRVAMVPPATAEAELPLHVAAAEAPRGEMLDGPVTLRVAAGRAAGLELLCRAAPESDGTIRAVLTAVDGNRIPTALAQPAPATVRCGDEEVWSGTLQEPAVLHLPLPADGAEVIRFTATLPAAALGEEGGDPVTAAGNPVWPAGAAERLPLFGEIHWHTELSGDGMRSLQTALRAGRDLINLDFIAPGDHSPRGPAWETTVRELEAADAPGSFATFFGWEASSNQGHENFYFTEPDHPLLPGGAAGFRGGKPAENTPLLDAQSARFLAIPHHTNAVSKAIRDDGSHYWEAYPWGAPRPDYRRVAEIFQTRGNQERERYPDDEAWQALYTGNGGSVQAGLEKGHRLGFIAGTDNHTGWPTVLPHFGNRRAYACAWSPARERRAVFDALYERRCWAAVGCRALVWYEVNGAPMGSEITVPPGTPLTARLRLSLQAPPAALEVVTAGDRAVPVPYEDGALDLRAEVPLGEAGAAGESAWYYLRARQTDGGLVYASPVFIDVNEDA